MTKRAHRVSAQFVQCLVPSLAGGDVVTDESSLSSIADAEEEEAVAVAPFPTLVAAHEGHLSASPGTDFNNFDLLRLMAGDTAGVALTRIGINSRNLCFPNLSCMSNTLSLPTRFRETCFAAES